MKRFVGLSGGTSLLLLPLALLSLGCTGDLKGEKSDDSQPSDGVPPGGELPGEVADPTTGLLPEDGQTTGDPDLAGLRDLRLLSRGEFNRTVRDLLGVDSAPADDFAQDPIGEHGFVEPALVTAERVRGYQGIAQELAEAAVADLDSVVACDEDAIGEDGCAQTFIDEFGLRAYRKPVSETEKAELFGLYQSLRTDHGASYTEAVAGLIEVMLQSPRFLYHRQSDSIPGQTGVVQLGPYELASRLSYLLWGSMPDEELFTAAASGSLETEEGVREQVKRMLADPKASGALGDFHDQWLDLARVISSTKDPTLFPDFSEDLKLALHRESLEFVNHVITADDARLETLMTANYSLMNEQVAGFYGESAVYGPEYRPVPHTDPARAGLLTHASIIAGESNPASTNPARAGFMVLNKLLCESIPPPPPGATDDFVMDDSLSVRQNFERLENGEAGATCTSCHLVLNPLGYGFESFDAIGQSRTHDGIHPVDATGFVESEEGTFFYDELAGMGAALLQAPEFRACYARKWMRFALGRLESEGDLFSLEVAYQDFAANDFNIAIYLEALATSRTFRFRALEEGETL